MSCEVCKDIGYILGGGCAVCACGTYRKYDGVYMSWGGGVQSTALAYMCINKHPDLIRVTGGNLPQLFLFADTGDEPSAVYEHVERCKKEILAAGFDFQVVKRKKMGREKLSDTLLDGRLNLPMWVGNGKSRGPLSRSCTVDWKVVPLDRGAKKYFGVELRRKKAKNPYVLQWYGISLDEAERVKSKDTSKVPWRDFTYPLVSLGWTRADCVSYLESIGINAPKSACTFCPFRSNSLWASLSEEEINRVVELENLVGELFLEGRGFFKRLKYLPTFHRSGRPIKERPWLDSKEDVSFNEECSGSCGV